MIPDNEQDNDAALAAESAAYLRRLQQEQDEAITAIAVLQQDIALAQTNGTDMAVIESLARAQAQLLRVALVRNKDVASSMQAANLNMFMRKMDAADAKRAEGAQKILTALGELLSVQAASQARFQKSLNALSRRQTKQFGESKDDRARLHQEIAEIQKTQTSPAARQQLLDEHHDLMARVAKIEDQLRANPPEAI